MKSWALLTFSGLLEVVWSIGLKKSDGFGNIPWTIATILVAAISFYTLAAAMKELPLGTAYAVFTGIGGLGAFAYGILFLGEPLALVRVASAALIVLGVIGLRASAL